MKEILIILTCLFAVIVAIKIFNEKDFKIPGDIALVLFSFLLFCGVRIVTQIFAIDLSGIVFYSFFQTFNLQEFLTEGVLCLILFAGASKIKLNKFVDSIKPITLLAFMGTIGFIVIFGFILYGFCLIAHINLNILHCLLIASILSPTEPFVVLHTLLNHGFSKSLSVTLEGEALINDGVGIAIFVFLKDCIKHNTQTITFFEICELFFVRILGAVVIGLVVSYLTFKLIKMTKGPLTHIYISLFTVFLVFTICEHFELSGDIASVVSGIYFSYKKQKIENWNSVVDPGGMYEQFWHIVGDMLNEMLFVLIGIYILFLDINITTILIALSVVIINVISRVLATTLASLPLKKAYLSNYNKPEFIAITSWLGLRGGVSLALALSTPAFIGEASGLTIWIVYIIVFFTLVVQGLLSERFVSFVDKSKKARQIKNFKEN